MPKIDDRIEAFEAKLKQLKVRQQRSEARARTIASRRARHQELRRKFSSGLSFWPRSENGEFDRKILHAWLAEALTRADDRALFELDGDT